MLNVWSQNWLRFFAPNDRIRHPLSAGFQGLKNRWLLNIGKGWKGMERWNIEIRWKQDENIWNKVLDASSQSMSIPGGWLWHLCKGEGSSGWGVFAWTDKHKYTTERFMNFTKDHRGVTKSEQCERHIPNIALSLSFSHVILHLTFNCFRRWRVSSDQNSSTGCFLNRCFDKQLFALKKTSFSCFCPIHSGVMFRVRLDEVIVFRPLKEDDIRAIAEAVLTWKMQHFLYHFCNTKKPKSRKRGEIQKGLQWKVDSEGFSVCNFLPAKVEFKKVLERLSDKAGWSCHMLHLHPVEDSLKSLALLIESYWFLLRYCLFMPFF